MAIFNSYASKSLPDNNDTVLIYDSATGKNKQMKYSDLARAIIEQYAGSSLNGSNQSVKNAINSAVGTNIAANTDLNSLTVPGFYYCPGASAAQSLENCPTTANFTMIVMRKAADLQNQLIIAGNAVARIYVRTRTSSAWQPWKSIATIENEVQPLQEQIGALRYVEFLVNADSTKTFSLPNAIQFKLITMSITTECMSEVLIVTANNGNLFYTEILKGTSITIDYSVKNKLTLTNSGAYGMRVRFLIFTSGKTITMDEEAATSLTSTSEETT